MGEEKKRGQSRLTGSQGRSQPLASATARRQSVPRNHFALAFGHSADTANTPMRIQRRLFPKAWMIVPVCAFVFIAWADFARIERVRFVSSVAMEDAKTDASSPTGYADGKRWLIVPEHNNPTFQWIEETQLMLARGEWRLRKGGLREFPRSAARCIQHRPLPVVAHARCLVRPRRVSGRSMGLSLEKAGLLADPLLHLLLLVSGTLVVARRFGSTCAALFSVGLAVIYPLAGGFIPGVANDYGMAQICALWSILLLVAGALAKSRRSSWFFAAGVAGGCGLWLNAVGQMPVIAGIALSEESLRHG